VKQSLRIKGLQNEQLITSASQATADPSAIALGISPVAQAGPEPQQQMVAAIPSSRNINNNSNWPLRDQGALHGWNHAFNSNAANKINDDGVVSF